MFKLVGDGGWVAFESASGAVEAARALMLERSEGALPARVAMYSGEAEQQADGDWLGVPLNRCARLLSLGHPGQVLVAGSTALLVGVDRRVLRELGLYHLRDVDEPIVVYQLVSEGLAAEFPPLRSDVQHVSLPVPRDRLVGRANELEHVGSLLRDHRLLTLTGVGGTGRTRLAIESARRVADNFELTAFVDLSALTQAGQIIPAVLDAAGAMMGGDQTAAADVLAVVFGLRRVLLVVDNAEHLLDGVGDLCDTVLDRCPHVRLLVMSREPLGVTGEQVWRVPSLETRGAAVELFWEHAGADVAESVAIEVCERLDGIPLAIELAGARARSLGAEEVLANLTAFFLAETAGSESAASRACIETARALTAALPEIAARSGLQVDVSFRCGLQWGATPYVGRITTAGRTEVTALGDEVNEAARIEACATGGRTIASKVLIERLDPVDATIVGIGPDRATYTTLADLATATDKLRRDAPSIAFCDV